jgi:hypothetical protein
VRASSFHPRALHSTVTPRARGIRGAILCVSVCQKVKEYRTVRQLRLEPAGGERAALGFAPSTAGGAHAAALLLSSWKSSTTIEVYLIARESRTILARCASTLFVPVALVRGVRVAGARKGHMRGCNTRARTSLVRDAQPRRMHDDHVQWQGSTEGRRRKGRNDSESIYSTRRGEHALPHVRAHAGGGS